MFLEIQISNRRRKKKKSEKKNQKKKLILLSQTQKPFSKLCAQLDVRKKVLHIRVYSFFPPSSEGQTVTTSTKAIKYLLEKPTEPHLFLSHTVCQPSAHTVKSECDIMNFLFLFVPQSYSKCISDGWMLFLNLIQSGKGWEKKGYLSTARISSSK